MATPKPQELVNTVTSQFPATEWMDTPPDFRTGTFCYAGKPKWVEYLGLPFPREWRPQDADWKLPPNWKEIILEGIRERLLKFRSFHLLMDICVRCGACCDKCPFFIRSGDPKK